MLSERIVYRSPQDLKKLVISTEHLIDLGGVSLLPPLAQDKIFEFSHANLGDLQRQFPERYFIYKQLLAAHFRNETQVDLSQGTLETLRVLNSVANYALSHLSGEASLLRGSQVGVFESLSAFLESGNKFGYIALPTGTGKTVIFCKLVEAMGLRSLIVVPTKVLMHQTKKRLDRFAPNLDVGMFFSESKELGRDVTLTTYRSLVSALNAGLMKPEEFDLVILDEAHLALGDQTKAAIEKLKKVHPFIIGLTATPDYNLEKGVRHLLPHEIDRMSIKEAVAEGLLCPFSVIIAETGVDISSVTVNQTGEYSERELEKAINIESLSVGAVRLYKTLFDGAPAIAFCCSVQHAKDLAQKFSNEGIRAESVSGKDSGEEQQRKIALFDSGEIQILTNDEVLVAGFDSVRARVALNLAPSMSQVKVGQRGGRPLRLDPDDPDKHAYIVDFTYIDKTRQDMMLTFAEYAEDALVLQAVSMHSQIPKYNLPDQEIANTRPIHIEGLKVTVAPQEVMNVVRDLKTAIVRKAPRGWRTYQQLAAETGATVDEISALLEPSRATNPSWFRLFGSSPSELQEYVALYLTYVAREKFRTKENEPPGNWIAVSEMKGCGDISMLLDTYRINQPEQFNEYEISRDKLVEYCAPTIWEQIKEEVSKIPFKDRAWVKLDEAHKMIPMDRKLAEQLIEESVLQNPTITQLRRIYHAWVEKCLSTSFVLNELIPGLQAYPDAPQYYLALREICKLLNSKPGETLECIDMHRESFLADIQQCRDAPPDKPFKIREYYSPRLIRCVAQELEKQLPADFPGQ